MDGHSINAARKKNASRVSAAIDLIKCTQLVNLTALQPFLKQNPFWLRSMLLCSENNFTLLPT